MRLDSYLAEYFPEHSRSAWQKHIAAGVVLVNDEVVRSSKFMLDEDDIVTVKELQNKPAPSVDIPIIYEDDNVLVLNKPTGLLTHAKGGALQHEFTVADFVKPFTTFTGDRHRPGIIHRLDRDTSGVIIAAKNEPTAKLLMRQFAERKVKKTYYAIVQGIPKHTEAKIELPIERHPKHPSQFRVGASGKSAMTQYKVIQSYKDYHLVELRPVTGRTHQLRVHLAYIGTPIVGDKIYGSVKAPRLFLHAAQLEVTIPEGKRRVFKASLPDEFQSFLHKEPHA